METEIGQGLAYSQLGALADQSEPVITQLMTAALANPALLSLAAGFTDNAVLPVDLVREATAALMATDAANANLQYGMNAGRPGLRDAVLRLLSGYAGEQLAGLGRDNVVICNGSQQALYISAQLFCNPGDEVLVEQPSYFVFLELLKGLGIRIRGIPVRADGGNDWEALAAELEAAQATGRIGRIKLMYLMGVYANPSTRCLEDSDRDAVVALWQRLGLQVPIIEDLAYRELYFDGPHPSVSFLGRPDAAALPILYCGTFTKPFATGLKTGFAVSRNRRWLENLASVKGHQDFGSAHLPQALIEWVLDNGRYPAHLAAIQRHYARKMALLDDALAAGGLRELGWRWQRPCGGLLMWAEGPAGMDTRMGSAFQRACLAEGVLTVPGDLCYPAGERCHAVRLSFGALPSERLAEAAERLCKAVRSLR